jgi:hypothetical protein
MTVVNHLNLKVHCWRCFIKHDQEASRCPLCGTTLLNWKDSVAAYRDFIASSAPRPSARPSALKKPRSVTPAHESQGTLF